MFSSLKHLVCSSCSCCHHVQGHPQGILLVVFLTFRGGFVWICLYFCNNLGGRKNNDVNSIYCVLSAERLGEERAER